MVVRKRQVIVSRGQRTAKPKQAKGPEPLVKVTLVGPLSMEDDCLRMAGEVFRRTGQKIQFSSTEMMELASGDVAPAEAPQVPVVQQGQRYVRPSQMVVKVGRSAAHNGNGHAAGARNQVVYQVVDRHSAAQINQATTRGAVASFLLIRGNHSAAEVIEGTGLRQKQVESALHSLRTEGVIQSVAVQ